MFRSTKTYDHNLGFSAAFRQWRATHSHCSFIHGYALAFHFVFETEKLDDRNWVVDFGDLDTLKKSLKHWFDHTTVVAFDDPAFQHFKGLHDKGIIDMRGMTNVGCEAFAHHAFMLAEHHCKIQFPHVRVVSAEVREHGANSAIYLGP
jgi:6-pyruvoyltetrahydropterin/6-carboxytetrahydropterin synthase